MTTRTYESEDLRVLWDAQRCVHAAACIRALPRVFNPLARPWVRTAGGSPEEIIAAVEACPTGALRYDRPAGPQESPPPATTIVPATDGPLLLRGDLVLMAPDGTMIAHETRLALCRCGASANKPFCDNSHRRVEFRGNDAILNDESSWEGRTGLSEPMPAPGSEWRERSAHWTRAVRINFPELHEYAAAVFAESESYVGALHGAALDYEVDLSGIGVRKQSMAWVVSTLVIGHLHDETGEISVVKALQGLPGFPVGH